MVPDFTGLFGSRRTSMAINAVMGVLLFVAALFLARDVLLLSFPSKSKPQESVGKPAAAPRPGLQDYAAILRNNPFGIQAGELIPLTAATATASASDVVLIGTVAGRRSLSYAIVSDKSGQQEVFRIGDKVFAAGTLERVEKDRIFVRSQGRDTEIPLADLTIMKEVKAGPAATGSIARRMGESSFVLDQQKVQQALEKPDQLMTDARFVPNIVDGRQQGFVLRELKAGGIYAGLGLQNGDVLLKINDFTISSPESALQAVTALRGIDRAQLDVIRNGAKITMTYQIR